MRIPKIATIEGVSAFQEIKKAGIFRLFIISGNLSCFDIPHINASCESIKELSLN